MTRLISYNESMKQARQAKPEQNGVSKPSAFGRKMRQLSEASRAAEKRLLSLAQINREIARMRGSG